MFKSFYPYEYVDSVHAIDYYKLYDMGYRSIIFDLDNTLTHHGENSSEEVDQLFKQIHEIGLKTLLLSNNCDERIELFLENIDSPFISNANKPKTENYFKAVSLLQTKIEETIMVGDQLFTDIYGANLSGMPNILVKYMRHDDKAKIGIRRHVENLILMLYKKRKTYQNRLGGIKREEL